MKPWRARSRLWHRYAYKERRTELHTNPFGRLGTGDTIVTEVRPAPDPRLTYRRVLERNGVALSKAELDRQDAAYRSRIARLAREDDSSDAGRTLRDDQLARRRAQMMFDDVVNTLQFDVVRREFLGGKPVIVVCLRRNQMRGRPQGGTARQGVHGQSVVRRSVAGTHASQRRGHRRCVVWRLRCQGLQGHGGVRRASQIEPGVWMPTKLTLTGEFRALFRRARIDHTVEWFDYRMIP